MGFQISTAHYLSWMTVSLIESNYTLPFNENDLICNVMENRNPVGVGDLFLC